MVDLMTDNVKEFKDGMLVHCANCFFKRIGFDTKKFMQGFNKPAPDGNDGEG
jgi:hypothetical protein